MPQSLSDAELTKFGVTFADEWPHAFDPAVEWWNESWFWDWFDADGRVAGHCRVGLHPNQQRAWIWFYHYHDGEWIAVEETRLPIESMTRAAPGGPGANGTCLAYDRFGLVFSWEPEAALRTGRFRFSGFGRVITGPRAGMILPVGADLRVEALGAAHSPGRANQPGHAAQPQYPASRFEQPIAVSGTLRAGDVERAYAGRGERDHSWGPRHWNLEWTFTVLNGDDLRLQCAEARIPNVPPIHGGYVSRASTQSITQARFDYRYRDESLERAVEGRLAVTTDDGAELAFELETISAVEIDITHTFVPPERSIYRRALVRARRESGAPLLGWTEFNRFAKR